MPELPDVVVYLDSIERDVVGHTIERIDVRGMAVLKSFDPPVMEAHGKKVIGTRRLGKRLIFELEDDLFLVIHLMIAGRLFWTKKDAKPGRDGLVLIRFAHGALMLREVAKKKRARMWLHRGEESMLEEHDRGGAEPLEISRDEFGELLTAENRTLKRALTNPRTFSGIGNAYSDEILLHAKLSPVKRTQQLKEDEIDRLYESVRSTLNDWVELLRAETGEGWPAKVTAFRPEMVVHGKFREPCSVCGTEVQRIAYAENEVNYCPQCQTDGKVLADRSLSRLLKEDWPRTVEELEGFRS
ncbi:MAG: DNA-formamidopyrimidine glycosylase family protein [Actinomycetota bacterium]